MQITRQRPAESFETARFHSPEHPSLIQTPDMPPRRRQLIGKLGRRTVKTTQLLAAIGESVGTGVAVVSDGLASTFGTAWAGIIHGMGDVVSHHGHDQLASGELDHARQERVQRLTSRLVQASGLFAVLDGTSTLRPMGADLIEGTGRATGVESLEATGGFLNSVSGKIANVPYVSDILPLHSFAEKVASTWQLGGSLGQYAAAALGAAIIARGVKRKYATVDTMYEAAETDQEAKYDSDRHKHIMFDRKLSALGAGIVGMSWLTPKVSRMVPGNVMDVLPLVQTPLHAVAAVAMTAIGLKVVDEFNPRRGHVCALSEHGGHDHVHGEDGSCSHQDTNSADVHAVHAHGQAGHGHDHHPAPLDDSVARHEKRRPRWRRMVAAGLAAAAFAGLAGGASTGTDAPEQTADAAPQIADEYTRVEHSPIESGRVVYDTLWQMSDDQVRRVTGRPADTAAVNVITKLTSHANRDTIADPGRVQPGQAILGLSDRSVEMIANGTRYDVTLAYYAGRLNAHASDQEALADTATLNALLEYTR